MKEILSIAKSFINRLNEEEHFNKDFKYGLDNFPKEYFECWYFDFKIISLRKVNNITKIGGAPGFIISKENREARIIAWWEKCQLEESELRLTELNKVLNQIESENWNLKSIQQLTGMKLNKVFKFKKQFQLFDLSTTSNKLFLLK